MEKTAQVILEEIAKTRQQIGTVSMALDGAQAHFMLESLIGALKTVADLLYVCKNTDPYNWNNNSYGSQEDSLKSAHELGLTAISTIKTFVYALPDNLKDFDSKITPDVLNLIENLIVENK